MSNKYNLKSYGPQIAWDTWLHQTIPQLFNTPLPELNSKEEKQLDKYVIDILNNKHPNLKELNNNQLDKLIAFINSLKLILQKRAIEIEKGIKFYLFKFLYFIFILRRCSFSARIRRNYSTYIAK